MIHKELISCKINQSVNLLNMLLLFWYLNCSCDGREEMDLCLPPMALVCCEHNRLGRNVNSAHRLHLCSLDVTCPKIRESITTYSWTGTLPWDYSVGRETSLSGFLRCVDIVFPMTEKINSHLVGVFFCITHVNYPSPHTHNGHDSVTLGKD